MRSTLLLVAFSFLLSPLVSFVEAKDPNKNRRAGSGRLLSRFDRNQDQKLDGKEAERLRHLFSTLSTLDTDNDGQLSDTEISAAKVEPTRRSRKAKAQ